VHWLQGIERANGGDIGSSELGADAFIYRYGIATGEGGGGRGVKEC